MVQKELCQQRIEYFVAIYLQRALSLPIPEFHREIYADLLDSSLKRLAYICPTGFGKTSVCALAYPLYLACYGLVDKIIIISASATFAERRLRDIKTEVENNELIRSDFGIEKGDIWRNEEISVIINGKRVTILALGKGSQITGERADVIISDDIETEDEAKSEVERASLLDYWYKTVMNRPTPGGRIIQIGSVSNRLAWMNRFTTEEAKQEGWVSKTFRTVKGHTIWKEKWSDEFLAAKRRELSAVPGIYEALYEADTSQIKKYHFQRGWLRHYEVLPAEVTIFAAVDPAIGEKVHNDYTAIVVGGIDLKGKLYIIQVIKKRFNVDTLELFGALFAIYDTYKPVKIGIESIGFQKFLKVFFERECIRVGKFPNVVELKTSSKISKEARISSLAPSFQAGDILLNKQMVGYNDFYSEYEAYPEVEHDDVLDAVSLLKDMAVPETGGANVGSVAPLIPARGNT